MQDLSSYEGARQCGHLGKSQRDWLIQASTMRWEGACSVGEVPDGEVHLQGPGGWIFWRG